MGTRGISRRDSLLMGSTALAASAFFRLDRLVAAAPLQPGEARDASSMVTMLHETRGMDAAGPSFPVECHQWPRDCGCRGCQRSYAVSRFGAPLPAEGTERVTDDRSATRTRST